MTTPRGQLKAIAPVPTAADFLDIVLSKTQRQTPTVIHKGFKISRIRSFYMRKVKFAQDAFHEKLDAILTEFPVLENLHPFLSALLNVLYDKNHYKLALGQLNTARHLIDNVGKEYARLLKFGDSLYRCKQLKKAALGRMATIMRRQKDPLAYLEQVRQHMSRLPSIDPTTRTLLVCGYPNVGKSSFVNKVTRADVDVQPYAFTTKSLFVGHLDYKYLRWQVIDTPGVLDHPLDEMNTIEMQSITALAHLRAAVMYFMDLSEQCGYSVEAQAKLFHSIKPLFANKPTFIVINKIDVVRPEDLDPDRKAILDEVLADGSVRLLQVSCHSDEGVMEVRNQACEALLAHRIDSKEKTKRVDSVANRLRVALPRARDDIQRVPFIPAVVAARRKYEAADPDRIRLEKDFEAEGGGAGVYSSDLKRDYLLKDISWNHDVIPEVVNGKNVADFIDADIEARLDELEREEEQLERDGFYQDDEDIVDSEEDAIRSTASLIRDRKVQMRADAQVRKKRNQNVAAVPRNRKPAPTMDQTSIALRSVGLDPSRIEARAAVTALAKQMKAAAKRKRSEADDDGSMEVDDEDAWEGVDENSMDLDNQERSTKRSRISTSIVPKGKRVPRTNRSTAGMRDQSQIDLAVKLKHLGSREPARMARAGEADRHVSTRMPKHLFSGKRKAGKTNRR